MSCLGPFELNIIKRKIIDKLYLFFPRDISYEKLRIAVDNPQEEDFRAAISYLLKETVILSNENGYTLTNEGIEIFKNQDKFNEYFPLADVPRTNFG